VRYGQHVEGTGCNCQFYANIIRQSCGRVFTDTVHLPTYDCYLIFPFTSPVSALVIAFIHYINVLLTAFR